MTRNFKISKDYIADYSFLGFIAVLPFLDILSPILLTVTIVLALLFEPKKDFFKRIKSVKMIWGLFLYFLIATISLAYSEDLNESLLKLSKLIAFVLIPLVFILVNPTKELLQKATRVFVYAMLIFSVFSLLKLGYNYIVHYDISHWYNFVQESMYHKYMPEDAMYLNTAFVLLLFGSFQKNMKLAGTILILIVIVLFGVRIGLFLYFLIASIYIVLNIRTLFTFKAIVLGGGVLILSLLLVNQSRFAKDKLFDTLQKIGFNTGDEVSEIGAEYHKIGLREKIWSSSLELIQEKPILGHGAGVEKKPLAKINERKGYDIPSNYHSHNQFLTVGVHYGMVGIAWLLSILAALFINAVRRKNLPEFLIITIMVVSMVTESFLEVQQGVFYFCVFISLFAFRSKSSLQ